MSKKFLSILLTLVMLLAVALPVMANTNGSATALGTSTSGAVRFYDTRPNNLRDLLESNDAVLATPHNLGIFIHHSPFVIPEGRTLTVETRLNIHGELRIEGTLIIAEGGRLNSQGNGSTITIASGGSLINHGHVENVSGSIFNNNGSIDNYANFFVRANTSFTGRNADVSFHRDANVSLND